MHEVIREVVGNRGLRFVLLHSQDSQGFDYVVYDRRSTPKRRSEISFTAFALRLRRYEMEMTPYQYQISEHGFMDR